MRRLESPAAQFFLDNLGWMVISLGLALVIWVVATLNVNPIEEQELPSAIPITFLEPTNEDYALYYSATLRREARVSVRAPRRVLNESIDAEDIEVIADLRKLESGTHVVRLEGRFKENTSAQIISISPSNITVEIFPRRTITMEVRIDTTGTLSSNYILEEVSCVPEEVTLSGPDIAINRVGWATVQLPIQNISGRYNSSYEVQLYSNSGASLSTRDSNNITISPPQLDCTVAITTIEEGETLLVDPVIVGNPPPEYIRGDFNAIPSEVLVIGDPERIAELGGVVQTQEINIEGRTSTFSREVQLVLPEGLEAIPAVTTVTINIMPRIVTRQIEEVPIQPINISPNLIASSLVPQTITVTFEGPAAIINDLEKEDLRITVDLQGRGAGTYTELPITVELLREIERNQVTITAQPQTVNIVISAPPSPTPAVTSNGIFGG
ncbi:MAG: hypothetical protein CUN55_08810 [Phototrophicales bacterium]|nr:MAG: hypothetical protein CUN55_08810 [Phototrophicales bacterium]